MGKPGGEPALLRPGPAQRCEEPTSLKSRGWASLGRRGKGIRSRLWAPEGGSTAINSEPREGGADTGCGQGSSCLIINFTFIWRIRFSVLLPIKEVKAQVSEGLVFKLFCHSSFIFPLK